MATDYYGDSSNFPVKYKIPSDGDKPSASSVNVAFEALGDRTANLAARATALDSLSVPQGRVTNLEFAVANIESLRAEAIRFLQPRVAAQAGEYYIPDGGTPLGTEYPTAKRITITGVKEDDYMVIDVTADVKVDATDLTTEALRLRCGWGVGASPSTLTAIGGMDTLLNNFTTDPDHYRVALSGLLQLSADNTYTFGLMVNLDVSNASAYISNYCIRILHCGTRSYL